MSSTTWTPTAVASEAVGTRLDLWRAVEAQHIVSTTVLVDTAEEQRILEDLLEASKPPRPPGCEGMHWLLFTPFRYPPPPSGSRFRGTIDPGVFYGAEDIRTACAELGYWRWRFLTESPALPGLDPKLQTIFRSIVAAPAIDLRQPPFAVDAAVWTNPHDYTATQAFARIAREAGIGFIRYRSVRDPKEGGCAAVLAPDAFAEKRPQESQSWWLSVTRERVIWHREDAIKRAHWEFEADTYTIPALRT
ncbi:MAG: RES family NAD+ phosphorylase [Rhodospirillaceae bacterium]